MRSGQIQQLFAASVALTIGLCLTARAADALAGKSDPAPTTRPVTAKPLSDASRRGLAWLAKNQRSDGGWSQGEASLDQYRQGEVGDRSDVADTCMAALAMVRAGSDPGGAEYASNISAAVNFVCEQVEKSQPEGLFITDIKGTRIQTKLGQYIDTFSVALLLAEVKNRTPDAALHQRVVAALDKTLLKIQKNQKEDGRWVEAHDGWASALCQSVATKAVNAAAQNGAAVSPQVLDRAQQYAGANFDPAGGAVATAGSANVELYARSANLGSMQDSANTNASRRLDLEKREAGAKQQIIASNQVIQRAATQPSSVKPEEVAAAKSSLATAQTELKDDTGQLVTIRQNDQTLEQARARIVDRFQDKQFVAGFGSNGGEEFLSYMNVGESLALKGGDEFTKWDQGMTQNLNRIQNEDGSWSGQHCITGRTFCTAAALMVLTVDRSVPVSNPDPVKSSK